MLVQAGEVDRAQRLEADLCIIGGGAAGIAMAREFDGSGLNVWLLESGGLSFDRKVQDLYLGPLLGRDNFPLDASRLRYFGGTTNHWRGACRPLEAFDFTPREWIADSGWPISHEDLEPYYPRASALCELPDQRFTLADLQDPDTYLPPFSRDVIETPVYQFSPPTRFGKRYRDALRHSKNVTLCLGANVTALRVATPPNRVDRVDVETLDGHHWSLTSRHFVLATGAIENARLLLVSNDVEAAGLGNQHDNVGRYFMDHLIAPASATLVAKPGVVTGLFLDQFAGQQHRPKALLVLGQRARARHRLAGHAAMLFPKGSSVGMQSYHYLSAALGTDSDIDNLWRHIGNMLGDAGDVASHLYYRFLSADPQPQRFTIYSQCEQVPNRDSRVRLVSERDALGMPRAALDWRLSDSDRQTLVHGMRLIAEEIGRSGVGRVRLRFEDLEQPLPASVIGDYHHMGTTRMHANPRHGVVDENCRVHGIANLHIAGSSVFTTSGTANPTLPLLALALRLGDRLRSEMRS